MNATLRPQGFSLLAQAQLGHDHGALLRSTQQKPIKQIMKWKLLAGMAYAVVATTVFADDTAAMRYDKHEAKLYETERDHPHDWKQYKGNEFNLSVFGTGTVGRRTLENPSRRIGNSKSK